MDGDCEQNLYVVGNTVCKIGGPGFKHQFRCGQKLCLYDNIFSNCAGVGMVEIHDVGEWEASRSVLSNNLFWNNGSAVTFRWGEWYTVKSSTEFSGFPFGSCNLLEDPLFVGPEQNNYNITLSSPAIDAGDEDFFNTVSDTFEALYGISLSVDYERNVRPFGNGLDIGAYEFGSIPASSQKYQVKSEKSGTISIVPVGRQGMYQLSFNQSKRANVSINLVNVLGQRIYSEQLRIFSGNYQRPIDLSRQASGVYIVQVNQGNQKHGIKLLK
jgi:hypothetical protein